MSLACALCHETFLPHQVRDCASCGRAVCPGCYESPLGLCDPCADAALLDDDQVLEDLLAHRYATIDGIATRARIGAFGRVSAVRPSAAWWVLRVRALLAGLASAGDAVCITHPSGCGADAGPRCVWTISDKAREASA